MSLRAQLVERGFPASRIEAALRNIEAPPTLDAAVAWLEAHPIVEDGATAVAPTEDPISVDADGEPIDPADTLSDNAGSLVCQDCGKRFRTPATAEYHAAKTSHVNFAESTEIIPELTPEQKAAKLADLRARADARKAAAAKVDAVEQRNNEILRRKADKDSAAMIERQKKLQITKEAEERRRQAKEDALAKQRIKDLIAADKKARQEKLERERAARAGEVVAAASSSSSPSPAATPPRQKKEYTDSRLQIRVDGQPPIVRTFPLDTTLFEVAHAVQDASGVPAPDAIFVTTFPTKRFGTEDLGLSLSEANLVNTAVMLRRT
ncbi:uncharacterized protein V1518DRAFT_438408 [Limtongia smithiae]|uniref:uncharacterized protein n=1 Tax=Limtongia smithiae TaxID=1125753 RepID=UPI0034CF3325